MAWGRSRNANLWWAFQTAWGHAPPHSLAYAGPNRVDAGGNASHAPPRASQAVTVRPRAESPIVEPGPGPARARERRAEVRAASREHDPRPRRRAPAERRGCGPALRYLGGGGQCRGSKGWGFGPGVSAGCADRAENKRRQDRIGQGMHNNPIGVLYTEVLSKRRARTRPAWVRTDPELNYT